MSHKKTSITDDEIKEFQEAIKGSTPLSQTRREPPQKPAKKIKPISHQQNKKKQYQAAHEDIQPEDLVGSEDTIHFSKPGLQHRFLQKLKRGQVPIEASLDLHGMTVAEAFDALDDFIAQCQSQGLRCVLVIHGKGGMARGDTPILKNQINQYLRRHSQVVAFHSAQGKHGGRGAIYILLKMQRDHPAT